MLTRWRSLVEKGLGERTNKGIRTCDVEEGKKKRSRAMHACGLMFFSVVLVKQGRLVVRTENLLSRERKVPALIYIALSRLSLNHKRPFTTYQETYVRSMPSAARNITSIGIRHV